MQIAARLAGFEGSPEARAASRSGCARYRRSNARFFWTYCEIGLDVRAYAMANVDVKRAACVGCRMCPHVCPRGLLKLEVKADRFRGGTPIRVYAVDL